MNYKFNEYFKNFLYMYYKDSSQLAKKLDRHPSRLRHWCNDALPGKNITDNLLESMESAFRVKEFEFNCRYAIGMMIVYPEDVNSLNNEELVGLILDKVKASITERIEWVEPLSKNQKIIKEIDYLKSLLEKHRVAEMIDIGEKLIEGYEAHMTIKQRLLSNKLLGVAYYRTAPIKSSAPMLEKSLIHINKAISLVDVHDGSEICELYRHQGNVYGTKAAMLGEIAVFEQSIKSHKLALEYCNLEEEREEYVKLCNNIAKSFGYLSIYGYDRTVLDDAMYYLKLGEAAISQKVGDLTKAHIIETTLFTLGFLARYGSIEQCIQEAEAIIDYRLRSINLPGKSYLIETIFLSICNLYSYAAGVLDRSDYYQVALKYAAMILDSTNSEEVKEVYYNALLIKYDVEMKLYFLNQEKTVNRINMDNFNECPEFLKIQFNFLGFILDRELSIKQHQYDDKTVNKILRQWELVELEIAESSMQNIQLSLGVEKVMYYLKLAYYTDRVELMEVKERFEDTWSNVELIKDTIIYYTYKVLKAGLFYIIYKATDKVEHKVNAEIVKREAMARLHEAEYKGITRKFIRECPYECIVKDEFF